MSKYLDRKQYLSIVRDYCRTHPVLELENEIALNRLSQYDAVHRAVPQGGKIQKIVDDALVSCGLSDNVDYRVMNFRDAIQDQGFHHYYERVKSAYNDNEVFRNDILEATKGFVHRISLSKPKRYSFHEPNQNPDWLRVYLLEEIAMYVNLFYEGYTVEVYPGADSPILRNLAEGKYGIFPEYKTRTHISVMDKGRVV